MRIRLVGPAVAALALVACDGERETLTGGSGAGGQGGASDASSTGAYGGMPLPPECDAELSPFIQPGCRDALREVCLAHTAEDDCLGTPPAKFRGYTVVCSWSKVVRFSDPAACAVDSVTWRCEAALRQDFIYYHDPCEVAGTDVFTHWTAIVSEQELVKAIYSGPIAPESPGYYAACGEGFHPPSPQPICSCTDVACDAVD